MTAEPRVLTPQQIAARQRTALQRALTNRVWETVEEVTDTEYTVLSSDGSQRYLVSLADPDNDGLPSCSCPAGFHKVPCRHVAAAVMMAGVPASWRAALGREEE